MIERGRLHRSERRVVAGVCGGIAEYFSLPPLLVRVIAVAIIVLGAGIPAVVYLVLYLIMPAEPQDFSAYVDVAPVTHETRSGRPERPLPPEGATCAASGASDSTARRAGQAPGVADDPGAAYAAAYSTARSSGNKHRTYDWYLLPLTALVVVLAVIGALSVASRFLPVNSPWVLWPIAVILGGLCIALSVGRSRRWSPARVLLGLDVVGFGIILLLCSLGVLGWASLISISLLWPLFLVALGVIIACLVRKSSLGSVAAGALIAVALVIGTVNFAAGTSILSPAHGPTEKGVTALADDEFAGNVTFDLHEYPGISSSVDVRSEQVRITGGEGDGITTRSTDASGIGYQYSLGDEVVAYTTLRPRAGARYAASDVTVSDFMTWGAFDVRALMSDVTLDLSTIDADDVSVSSNVGALRLELGDPGNTVRTVRVTGRASGIQIVVPEGCAAVVNIDGPLLSKRAHGDVEHVSGTNRWVTSAYADAVRNSGGYWIVEFEGSCCDVSMFADAGSTEEVDASAGTASTPAQANDEDASEILDALGEQGEA